MAEPNIPMNRPGRAKNMENLEDNPAYIYGAKNDENAYDLRPSEEVSCYLHFYSGTENHIVMHKTGTVMDYDAGTGWVRIWLEPVLGPVVVLANLQEPLNTFDEVLSLQEFSMSEIAYLIAPLSHTETMWQYEKEVLR